jgi:hypothetical protein
VPGLLRGLARTALVAGTATAVSNRVSRRQAGRWAAQEAEYAPPPQYAPPQYASPQYAPPPEYAPPPGPPAGDTIAQLKELGELRSQGVLTDTEFAQQKARILGS